MQLHISILYNPSFKHHNNRISYISDTTSQKNKIKERTIIFNHSQNNAFNIRCTILCADKII